MQLNIDSSDAALAILDLGLAVCSSAETDFLRATGDNVPKLISVLKYRPEPPARRQKERLELEA